MANTSRNAGARFDRRRRWAPARDALWEFLAPHLDEGARVAIVGAGNGDDLPLRRIVRCAGAVTLIDIDPGAARGARRRLGRAECRKVTVIGHDVTRGAADSIALAALRGDAVTWATPNAAVQSGNPVDLPGTQGAVDLSHPTCNSGGKDRPHPTAPPDPLPGAPYDLVIGDLFYSQLLYPALLDLGVDVDRRNAILAEHAPSLTRAAVARLHAPQPLHACRSMDDKRAGVGPCVVHIHDPLGWWDGHEQAVGLDDILDLAAAAGPDAGLALAARGDGPHESDPRAALRGLGLHPAAGALWRWPFAPGVDYLTCATLVDAPPAFTGSAGDRRFRPAAPPAR